MFIKHKCQQKLSLDGFRLLVSEIDRTLHRQVKISKQTVEEKIEDRKWPTGGLSEMQEAVSSQAGDHANQCMAMELKEVRALLAASFYTGHILLFLCKMCTSFLILSGLILENAQGRIQGIGEMTLADAYDLLDHGYASKAKHKTAATYGDQFVINGGLTNDILLIYLVKRHKVLLETNIRDSLSKSLWINEKGTVNNVENNTA